MTALETFYQTEVSDQGHPTGDNLLDNRPIELGSMAMQVIESDAKIDIGFFMERSAAVLDEMGLIRFHSISIGNNYFEGLKAFSKSETYLDNNASVDYLIRLAAGCAASKNSTPGDKSTIGILPNLDNDLLDHIQKNAFTYLLSLNVVKGQAVVGLDELRKREIVIAQNPQITRQLVDHKPKFKETELDFFLSSALNRARKIQSLTYKIQQFGIESLI
jgi:hypothetical protein